MPAAAWPPSRASWRSARTGWSTWPRERPGGRDPPPPRLLGAFDPLLHGWVSREPILGPHRGIMTVNGLFRPFALVEGRAVATWGLAGRGGELDWLAEVPGAARAALAADEADIRRFLGLPLISGLAWFPAWPDGGRATSLAHGRRRKCRRGWTRLGEDLLLLAIRPNGTIGSAAKIDFGLMGSELVRLAAPSRVDIAGDRIIVRSARPDG